jgi:ABC-2 type transport system permease protein
VRFREVYRYELEQTQRGAAVWIYGALLFLFAAWITFFSHDNGMHARGIYFNSPMRLTHVAVAASLFGLLVTAGLFGAAAVRDIEAGMEPLLFTTPLRKVEYLGGRFLAALSVNAVLLLAIPLAQVAVALLWRRFDPDLMGPVRIVVYLQYLPLLLIPGLLFTAGILFAIAMLARQVIPVYIGAILLFIFTLIAANYVGRIENPFLSALIDPSGIATLQRMSRYWTPVEQNARLVGFPAPLLWSRVVLLALATVMLAIVQRRFRLVHDDGGGRRRSPRSEVVPVGAERVVPVSMPRVQGTFARFAWLRQTFGVARRCFGEVTASRAFVFVLLLSFGLTLLWGNNVGATVFDTPVWPVTHLVASVALSQRNVPIIFLLIALYAGEMVWKDRTVGMAEIADAAPVSEGVAVLGRFLAVVATLALLTVVCMAAGMTIQATQGYYDFEPGLYLRILFGLNFANYVLWAAVGMTIHVLVNQKYVGHMLMMVFFILIMGAAEAYGIDHHLLVYSTGPDWTYSDMNGFGPFIGPFVWFKLYWAAWAALLLVVSSVLWVRGREPGVMRRLRVAGARLHGATVRAATIAIALILLLGGFIFYNTNILNEYHRPRNRGAPQAEYEKRYTRFENAPQPTIVSAQLRMEIYPESPAVDFTGTYRVANRTNAPIDSVHVYTTPQIEVRRVSFDRPAKSVLVDDEVGYRIYALEQPLQPGDSLQLSFDITRHSRGFPNNDIPASVVKNGSTFNRAWLPMIGYQPMFELSDERERFGLPPRKPPASASDSAELQQRRSVRNEDLVRVEAIIGTSADQIAVTPGVLRRSWKENGRAYFQYDTDIPEGFGVTVLSGRYAVREDRWKDVALRIYHHPQHTGNLDRVVHGMKASLEYFSDQFGPYQYRHLSLVEHPPYGGFGSAHPALIKFTESFFLTRVGAGDVDEPFYGTAHEIAHMWWDGQTQAASVPGHGFLTESLANYSAMILTEKVYGQEMGRRVYDTQMNRYLRGRAEQAREVPALDVEDQPYIAYRKGATALIQLRDLIGEERVNTALRRFVEKYRAPGPPFPTSRDLYAELHAVTPDSLHGLLVDLFETITLWDVRTQQAIVARNAAGAYEVTLHVVAKKTRADRDGDETEVPMNDLVEIGVFAADDAEPLYLTRHRIRSGTQTIRITVPRAPVRAGIDPRRRLFERDREDNVVEVKAAGDR